MENESEKRSGIKRQVITILGTVVVTTIVVVTCMEIKKRRAIVPLFDLDQQLKDIIANSVDGSQLGVFRNELILGTPVNN